jgi:uncharacterized protein YjeT (DUF2065 family)
MMLGVVMMLAGLLPGLFPSTFSDLMGTWQQKPQESIFRWLFQEMYVPMNATSR